MYALFTFLRGLVPPLFITTAVVIVLFSIVNGSVNTYRKDNAAIRRARKILSAKKESLAAFALALPLCYKYQWQLFMRINDKRASSVFSFCVKTERLVFCFLPVSLTLSCLVLALCETVFNGSTTSYVIYGGIAIGLLMVLAVSFAARGLRCKRHKAKRLLGNLLDDMDLLFGDYHDFGHKSTALENDIKQSPTPIDDVIGKVNYLRQKGLTEQSAQRIAQLISKQKLEQPRTVAQQRKLNEALNGLVRYVSLKDTNNPIQE